MCVSTDTELQPADSAGRRLAAALGCALSLTLVAGCGGVEPKDGLVRAYGYVTLDGEPLKDAQVTFDHPQEAETFGRTDSSGYYDVWFTRSQRGAFAGPNAVWFTTFDPDLGREELVPKQYRAGQSDLSVEVTEDGSPYNFDLESMASPE